MGKIVVFGSYVTDLTGWAGHLPVPGETVIGSSFKMGPGGKGSNQAVAAHRAGADMKIITKVGDDVFGREAIDFYMKEGMDTDMVFIDKEKETGSALIMVDEITGQNSILVTSGACGNITDSDIEKARPYIEQAEILLLQFEINLDALYKIIDIAHAAGVRVVLNPAPAMEIDESILCKVDVVTPNEVEAAILTGIKEVVDMESATRAARVFFQKGVGAVVITMGKAGVFVMQGEEARFVKSRSVKAVDTTGAGDAFNGGFVTALSEEKDIFAAVEFGNVVGALSVTKKGTAPSMPRREEIDRML
ncbi:ribokinase [Zongyangia hominis]|uniref:Ribokinase n=1 Tax=Zongyangia hominis TaxID=2763677 RepID=A0A926EFL5_9FIRM|nr:ribokinase [Zongyangia hominis]MBC8570792.1 ribokinase [Zongyangia hominis]